MIDNLRKYLLREIWLSASIKQQQQVKSYNFTVLTFQFYKGDDNLPIRCVAELSSNITIMNECVYHYHTL